MLIGRGWGGMRRYEGEWARNLPSNMGTMVCTTGATYEGGWVRGMRHGTGTYVTQKFTYSGDWFEDKMTGFCPVSIYFLQYGFNRVQ